MIRFRVKELISDKSFREDRRVTVNEVAQQTGIHRATLSKLVNEKGYNTGTENIDRLCSYFGCSVGEVMEFIPDDVTDGQK